MRLLSLVVLLALSSSFLSCESTVTCGPGTALSGGACVPTQGLSCGTGTTVMGDACVAIASCGAGTVNQGGSCVPQSPLSCGTGTTAINGRCEASIQTCGAGTSALGTSCVAPVQQCGAGTTLQNATCVATVQSCGAGTSAQGTSCVAALQSCGAGTTASGTQCVTQGLTCGAGTATVGSQCAVNLGTVCSTDTVGAGGTTCVGRVTCATGTTRVADACQPQLSTLCGPGTHVVSGRCELDGAVACGPGTTLTGGRCVLPTPVPSLATFTASTSLNVAYDHEDYYYMTGTRTWHRVIITDLSAGNALSWATSQIAPVGTGAALHLKLDSLSLSLNSSITKTIANARFTGGACDTSLVPTDLAGTTAETYANFYGWSLATPTMNACSAAGSVRLDRLMINSVDTVRITLNVQFNDGTVWMDKIYTAPYN